MLNNVKEKEILERIRDEYQEKTVSKTQKIQELDAKVRRPAEIFAYSFGVVSALVFGTGMSLAMRVIGETLHPIIGIAVGVVGMTMCGANYLIYKKWLKSRKAKYAEEIIGLCDEALDNDK